MPIGTNDAIEKFGTQAALDNTSGTVADAAFSAASDLSAWTNADDAAFATAILEATFSVAPTANTTVDLFAQLLNIETANDQDLPDANYQHVYLGSFPLNNVTSAQFIAIEIGLPNTKASQEYQFIIRNNGGQTISAGWDLRITPKSIGPSA